MEAQGRSARCKRCGEKFEVPKADSLEDSIMAWLAEPDDAEEALDRPRVVNLPSDSEGGHRRNNSPIRLKSSANDDSNS